MKNKFDWHYWLTREFNPVFNILISNFRGGSKVLVNQVVGQYASSSYSESDYVLQCLQTRRDQLNQSLFATKDGEAINVIKNWIEETGKFLDDRGSYCWEISEDFKLNASLSMFEFISDLEVKRFMSEHEAAFREKINKMRNEYSKLQREKENVELTISNLKRGELALQEKLQEIEASVENEKEVLRKEIQRKNREIDLQKKKAEDELHKIQANLEKEAQEKKKEIELQTKKTENELNAIKRRRKIARVIDGAVTKIFGK